MRGTNLKSGAAGLGAFPAGDGAGVATAACGAGNSGAGGAANACAGGIIGGVAGMPTGGVGGAMRGRSLCPHSWQKTRCSGLSRPQVVQITRLNGT